MKLLIFHVLRRNLEQTCVLLCRNVILLFQVLYSLLVLWNDSKNAFNSGEGAKQDQDAGIERQNNEPETNSDPRSIPSLS